MGLGIALTIIFAVLLGYLGGLLTFKAKLKWCDRCGATLQCLECSRVSQP